MFCSTGKSSRIKTQPQQTFFLAKVDLLSAWKARIVGIEQKQTGENTRPHLPRTEKCQDTQIKEKKEEQITDQSLYELSPAGNVKESELYN